MPRPESDTEYQKLPERYREGMRRYIEEGIMPGSFLKAVLEDRLHDAVVTCDLLSQIRDIVLWVYNEAPGRCWGSPEKVRQWVRGDLKSDGEDE
jgi:hypothetical protein